MAKRALDTLKSFFLTGLYPTQQQFHDMLDSFVHKDDGIDISNVFGLYDVLNGKYPANSATLLETTVAENKTGIAELQAEVTDNGEAISANTSKLAELEQKVGQNGVEVQISLKKEKIKESDGNLFAVIQSGTKQEDYAQMVYLLSRRKSRSNGRGRGWTTPFFGILSANPDKIDAYNKPWNKDECAWPCTGQVTEFFGGTHKLNHSSESLATTECLQYFTNAGFCEFEDVVVNCFDKGTSKCTIRKFAVALYRRQDNGRYDRCSNFAKFNLRVYNARDAETTSGYLIEIL